MDIQDLSKEELIKELQALQAITDQFKLLFNNAPLGYQSLDFDGNFKEVNQQWLDTLGYEREEVIGKWFGDFLTPAFKDGFRKRFPLFKAQGKIHSEFEMVHKNGSVLFIAFDGTIGYDSKGNFKQTHCIIQDITEKKQAELALRESEEEYRNLINLSPVAMGIINDWKTIYFNPAAVWLFGAKTQNELLGKHIFELIHPDFHELAIENAELLAEKGYVSMQEQKYIKLDGSILDVEIQVKSIRFNDDTAALVIIDDITERKKAEKTLRESRDEFKLIISSQQDMMVKTDTRGYLLFVNPAYCAVFGKTEDELVGTNYAPMVHPDDHPTVEKAVAQLFVPPYTCSYEERAWTVDGLRWLSWTAKAVLDDNGNVIALVGSGRDITAGKLAEDALRESEAQLKEAQRIAKIGSWDLDIVNNILKWSDEIYSMFEIDPNIFSATYEAFLEAIHPDDRESVNFAYTNSLSTRSPYSIEHRLRLSNGKIKYVQEKCESFFDADGKPLRSIGTVQDITGRKLTEQALVQSHELMRYVIEHNQSAIAIHDKDLKYIYVSQRYLHDYNIKEKDIIGKHHYDVFPDLPQKWRDVHQKALSGVISSADNDSYMREDGTLEWTRWECRPWYEADGSIGGIIIYTEVITERKQAEEALRKSEENHSITLQSIGDGVISTDLNGLIVNMNPVAEKLCDWKLTDALGKPLPEVFKIINAETRQTVADPVEKVLRKGEIVGLGNHTVLISKDGIEYQIADSAAPIKTKEGEITGVVLVFSDVTEKYAAAEAFRKSEERYRFLFENNPFPLWIYDVETLQFLAVNETAVLKYGYSKAEFLDMTLNDIRPPEDIPALLESVAKDTDVFQKSSNWRHKTKQGEVILVEIVSHSIEYSGRPARLVIPNDITERKQAEVALQASKDYLDKIINSVASPIFVKDEKHNFRLVNDALCKLLNLTQVNLIGKTGREHFPDDQNEVFLAIDKAVLNTGKENVNEEQLTDGTGKIRTIITKKTLYTDNDKNKFLVGVINDITERKQAEEAVRKSEENLSITLKSIGDGVISTDLNGLIVNMNPVAEKLCDWKLTDALGKPLPEVFKIINAETRKTDTDPVKKVLENGEIVGLANHTVLISKNGNEYQIADSAAPIKTKEGAITGVVLVFSDVTEKYAAQRQIKESEERFQLAMNASNDGLFDWNLETNDIYYAPSWKKMLGYEDHELPNDFSVWENTTEPEDVKKSWELQQKLIARQIDQFVLEFKMKHKHGHWVDILSRAKAIFDDNGKAIRIVGTHADITERKQTEEKIREKEVQYRNLANFGLALIWTAGTDKLCNYFNEPWLKFTGRKLEQELGNGWAEGVHPDDFDRCLETYVTAFDKKESFEMEYRLMHFSGEYRWILDLGNPNYNSSGEFIGYIGHCFDITERKRIEQELVKAIDQAQESDRLKSAFLANMSHEIRTPMNGILGFAGLLKEPGLTGEQQQEYIRIIEKSGVRMLNIINDIVDISKIEAGLMKLDMKETNINEQIEYIYTFFKPEVEAKGMKLSFNTPLPAKEAVITTDREKVYAILTNLVKNAIKFTNNGSIEFGYKIANTLPVEETLHATSQQVSSQQVSSQQVTSLQMQFYVKDTGVGIPIDRQEAIFERFVQADIADKMAHQGAGLGLSITKAYIEMLGGKIWVESEVGIGSIFYFTLPYHADPMKKNVAHQLATSDKTDQIRKLKILITEDDDVSEMLIDLTVKSFGKEVLKARTGFEAVEVCKKNPDMDLVLMDIQLPEMNGYDATRQIREFNKEVIIIAQTAYGQSGDREMAIKSGCNDYIAKPISKDELFELIHTYFGK